MFESYIRIGLSNYRLDCTMASKFLGRQSATRNFYWVPLLFMMMLTFITQDNMFAQLNQSRPQLVEGVEVEEKLGDTIPLQLKFANAAGDSILLADLFEKGKPVLLNPLYYDCPVLCGVVADAVLAVAEDLVWSPGNEYEIISFSIDPAETPDQASQTKNRIMQEFSRTSAENGWHFLTGNEETIQELTEAIGFRYAYDEASDEYIHAASIQLISPEGVITRYLYGLEFKEFDLRNALYEAADGKIGNTIEKLLLYCFTYDPSSNSYVPVAINIMKIGGLATLIILGIFLAFLWARDKAFSTSV